MNDAIGGILPLALAIALSPPPIIVVVLLLLSPRAKLASLGFLVGWVVGILIAIVALTAVSSLIPEGDPDAPQPVLGVLQLAIGLAVLVLAVRYVRSRPRAGETPPPPKWMAAIDRLTPVSAIGFGFALAALNPKNLLLAFNASLEIGSEYLELGEIAIVIAIFTAIAASSVIVPTVAYLVASDRLAAPLRALEEWLLQNSWAVMALLMLVIGVMVIGNGIESF